MSTNEHRFSGPIPETYDDYLGTLMFEPFALDLAARLAGLARGAVLEVAAGTGVVTRALARTVPGAVRIVATDLAEPMLRVSEARAARPGIEYRCADAQQLPFDDASFDAVVCQFGIMFVPDKVVAYREARRVLAPGARFLCNTWGPLDDNVLSRIVSDVAMASFPDDPPRFLPNVPFGYTDAARIERELRAAGFTDLSIETVDKRAKCASPEHAAIGLCQGTPIRAELEARGPLALAHVTAKVSEAIAAYYGAGSFEHTMRALVVTATA